MRRVLLLLMIGSLFVGSVVAGTGSPGRADHDGNNTERCPAPNVCVYPEPKYQGQSWAEMEEPKFCDQSFKFRSYIHKHGGMTLYMYTGENCTGTETKAKNGDHSADVNFKSFKLH